jgi:hypothetical protein
MGKYLLLSIDGKDGLDAISFQLDWIGLIGY